MELKKSFNPGKVLVILYVVLLVGFLVYGLSPAEATAQDVVSGEIEIPAIELKSTVVELEKHENKLDTPATIVGSYTRAKNKILLIGHSNTVFQELGEVVVGDNIIYNGEIYTITDAVLMEKSEIKMREVLKAEAEKTLVIMTCAGEDLGGGNFPQRIMITAKVL